MPGLGLTLKDPARYQGTWTPPLNDPNLYGWWSADDYLSITEDVRVQVVGNKADYQVDKTDRTTPGTTNLSYRAALYEPFATRLDDLENLFKYSDTLTNGAWTVTGCTKNSDTLVTFTATNGNIRQQWWSGAFVPNTTYTISAKLRQVSGNTALQWQILGSTYVNVNITNVSTLYSYDFTSPATSVDSSYFGIRDPNGAGFGQLEILEFSIRKATTSSTHLATIKWPMIACRFPATGRRMFLFVSNFAFKHINVGVNTIPMPFTVYQTIQPNPWTNPDRILSFGVGLYDYIVAWETNFAGRARVYTAGTPSTIQMATGTWVDYAWQIMTLTVNNGGTSSIQKNLDAAVTGALDNVAASGLTMWGGCDGDANWSSFNTTDMIIRSGIDDAATQTQYIQYLASRVGLVL